MNIINLRFKLKVQINVLCLNFKEFNKRIIIHNLPLYIGGKIGSMMSIKIKELRNQVLTIQYDFQND